METRNRVGRFAILLGARKVISGVRHERLAQTLGLLRVLGPLCTVERLKGLLVALAIGRAAKLRACRLQPRAEAGYR